ncbi:MAG: KEOPS complex kinase/ATPase Bud32 [Candidatus Aenigmarchaeota archaeon]
MKIVQRGAEAVLYMGTHEGEKALVKERVKKGYRIQELDSVIRRRRTRMETRMLDRARRAGVHTPKVWSSEGSKITMEWIEGKRVKDCLNDMPKTGRMKTYKLMGEAAARLHKAGLVHGDLTTSNMILKGDRLYVIDFGLGKMSEKVEDQAVDLYLLYEAIRSTHFRLLEEAWKNVLKAYTLKYTIANAVIKRLDKIKSRRRYA